MASRRSPTLLVAPCTDFAAIDDSAAHRRQDAKVEMAEVGRKRGVVDVVRPVNRRRKSAAQDWSTDRA